MRSQRDPAVPSCECGGSARCILWRSISSLIAGVGRRAVARIVDAAILRAPAAAPAPVLAFWLFFAPAPPNAIEGIANAVMVLVHDNIPNVTFISAAEAQPIPLAKPQLDALNAYENALSQFKSILRERRAQINSKQQLPTLPGQALYLARNNMISAYKDLTDELPSKISIPNKFGLPPAYFDAANEPLLEEYTNLFNIMQAPPAKTQKSD